MRIFYARFLLMAALLACRQDADAQSQLANGGFEQWHPNGSSEAPDSFSFTGNGGKSTTAHTGQYSISIQSERPSFTKDGTLSTIQTINAPIRALTFWYQSNSPDKDMGTADANIYDGSGNLIGHGFMRILPEVVEWTQGTLYIQYFFGGKPDDVRGVNLQFRTGTSAGKPHLGTELLIDDIEIYSYTSVAENKNPSFSISPNPSVNGEVNIALPAGKTCNLSIWTVTGSRLYEAQGVNGKQQISCKNWPSGICIVRLEVDGNFSYQRFTVTN